MKTFIFEGHSDDTFGEYGVTNDDYDNCASGRPIQFSLIQPDKSGIIVTGIYCNSINRGEGWMIGIENLSEANPFTGECILNPSYKGYRNQLTVSAHDDSVLTCLNRSDSER